VGLGSAAFSMQDIVLEPYGGEVLHLPVGATSLLTGLLALGALAAFALAARRLQRGSEPHRLAALGVLVGIAAFAAVIFAAPLDSAWLFRAGAMAIGFGGGLFSVALLTAAMGLEENGHTGLAIGAWGAVQASAIGVATAAGGALRDLVGSLATSGALGEALALPSVGYSFVYHLEILLLFATLAVLGPLCTAAAARGEAGRPQHPFGLAEFPG
jgi:MFS transporter, BCD family, chlorophyll transporter